MRIDIDNVKYPYDLVPDICPLCHHGIEPQFIASNVVKRKSHEGNILQLLFRCARQDCQRAFIATYWQSRNLRNMIDDVYSLRNTAPYRGIEPSIAKEIRALSEKFVEIYSQAHSAEHYGLNQVAGVGYRKALEFLLKDFCISNNPDKIEQIKTKFLGACINDFVDDVNIKECAKRAAWLRNDETHYVRKWEDKEIKDLKIVLELTMAWIRNYLSTAQYLANMNNVT